MDIILKTGGPKINEKERKVFYVGDKAAWEKKKSMKVIFLTRKV